MWNFNELEEVCEICKGNGNFIVGKGFKQRCIACQNGKILTENGKNFVEFFNKWILPEIKEEIRETRRELYRSMSGDENDY